MKLFSAALLSSVLFLGVAVATAQDRDDQRWNGNNGQYGAYNQQNNAKYQSGYNDGINAARADIQQGKAYGVEQHPYYRDSSTQAYKQGFIAGYRATFNQAGRNNGYYGRGDNGYYGNRNDGYYGNGNNGYSNKGRDRDDHERREHERREHERRDHHDDDDR